MELSYARPDVSMTFKNKGFILVIKLFYICWREREVFNDVTLGFAQKLVIKVIDDRYILRLRRFLKDRTRLNSAKAKCCK